MNVTVDRKTCLRSGQCMYLHPKLFKEDAEGYPVVQFEGEIPEELEQEANDAADVCPSGAINPEG